jgi:hypothetical protein
MKAFLQFLAVTLLALPVLGATELVATRALRCETIYLQATTPAPVRTTTKTADLLGLNDIYLSQELMIPASAIKHLFHGDVESIPLRKDGKFRYLRTLKGGLHTLSGLRKFLLDRPSVAKALKDEPDLIQKFPNGVLAIQLPDFSFSPGVSQTDPEPKTFFPAQWSDDEILKSISIIAKNGRRFGDYNNYGLKSSGDERKYSVIGTYKGVRMIVVIAPGRPASRVITAYPDTDQNY